MLVIAFFGETNAGKSMDTSNIINERIIVNLHALNWTMGEVAFFDITVADIGELMVDWGDGHVSHYHPHYDGERLKVEHDYGKKAKISRQHFVVNIECIGTTFKSFDTGCLDMEIDDIDFRGSPSIESLTMTWLGKIDLSSITALKHLDCIGSAASVLDFRKNTNLETLNCSCSQTQKLILSHCDKLRELNCAYCFTLREIALSNNSQLSKIALSTNHTIRPKSWEYVQKIIHRNHGVIDYQDIE